MNAMFIRAAGSIEKRHDILLTASHSMSPTQNGRISTMTVALSITKLTTAWSSSFRTPTIGPITSAPHIAQGSCPPDEANSAVKPRLSFATVMHSMARPCPRFPSLGWEHEPTVKAGTGSGRRPFRRTRLRPPRPCSAFLALRQSRCSVRNPYRQLAAGDERRQ